MRARETLDRIQAADLRKGPTADDILPLVKCFRFPRRQFLDKASVAHSVQLVLW